MPVRFSFFVLFVDLIFLSVNECSWKNCHAYLSESIQTNCLQDYYFLNSCLEGFLFIGIKTRPKFFVEFNLLVMNGTSNSLHKLSLFPFPFQCQNILFTCALCLSNRVLYIIKSITVACLFPCKFGSFLFQSYFKTELT